MRQKDDDALQLDFGTYHHSTAFASQRKRERAGTQFSQAFAELPFSRDDPMKILDIGCGLGFLCCVCAGYYPHAVVTGFDTFEHQSLKGPSITKARKNVLVSGFSRRIRFEKGDALTSDYRRGKFDLFVSNLVYHNLGKKRFDAYKKLALWMNPGSYAVIGDIYFDYSADLRQLRGLFGLARARPRLRSDGEYRVLVLSLQK